MADGARSRETSWSEGNLLDEVWGRCNLEAKLRGFIRVDGCVLINGVNSLILVNRVTAYQHAFSGISRSYRSGKVIFLCCLDRMEKRRKTIDPFCEMFLCRLGFVEPKCHPHVTRVLSLRLGRRQNVINDLVLPGKRHDIIRLGDLCPSG